MSQKDSNNLSRKDTVDVNRKYFGEPSKCRRCGTTTTAFYHETADIDSTILCQRCKLALNPPEMRLSLLKSGKLWNVTGLHLENDMILKNFEECGWFLRKEVTYYTADPGRVYDLYLEYYGVAQCQRFINHKFFYPGMLECLHRPCRKYELRRGNIPYTAEQYLDLYASNNPYRL